MTNNKQCGICANCVPQIGGGSGFNNCEEAHAAQMAEDKAMNNKLTDEEITELALKLFDGSSFYFQSGMRPGAKTMAELLNKAACAVAELQEFRNSYQWRKGIPDDE
ncbi:hypothetical protein JGY68_002138 [Salmonella enterica]|nr:hypothetical protein [Salmonella enterica]EGH5309439.1 hypothetical protein [Salmonella enterica]EGW8385395.1 hypothetical protein [Salmonella enterica]EHL2428940.1 hypothetical protein [Salmonella enterica]EHO4317629.1 hypothetical protein [Salmonella enterica]